MADLHLHAPRRSPAPRLSRARAHLAGRGANSTVVGEAFGQEAVPDGHGHPPTHSIGASSGLAEDLRFDGHLQGDGDLQGGSDLQGDGHDRAGVATGADDRRRAGETGRGRQADHPEGFTRTAWVDVGRRVMAEARDDNVPLLAAGVAFFALISLVPALVAMIAIYGLAADPTEVADHLSSLTEALPAQAADLLVQQVERIAAASPGALGLSAAVALATALWSASSGMRWMMAALSLTYDQRETRTFVRLRGRALLLTAVAIVCVVVSVSLIAVLPAVCDLLGLGAVGTTMAAVVRWPLLAGLVVVAFSALYRFGPDRPPARWRWITPGAVAATVIWLAASAGFATYASLAGSFDETYGPLGGVVVLLLWLHLSALAVLMGAEVNAEMEHQTARDTTTGPERPLGTRGAVVADTVGASADELAGTGPSGAPVDSPPDQG